MGDVESQVAAIVVYEESLVSRLNSHAWSSKGEDQDVILLSGGDDPGRCCRFLGAEALEAAGGESGRCKGHLFRNEVGTTSIGDPTFHATGSGQQSRVLS